MAEAGRDRGYNYLAITDHSASHGFGDHVTAERLWERIEEVRAWNKGKRTKGFRLLSGSEINIGLDGTLDYPDDLVAALDWVVASVHTSFSVSERQMTERVLAAIENPERRLHRPPHRPPDRPPRALRDRRRGGRRGGGPHRHDDRDQRQPQPPRPLRPPRPPRRARPASKIVLNTDAHGVDTLDNMAYAVATARRAWLTADDVANTRGWSEFKKLIGS